MLGGQGRWCYFEPEACYIYVTFQRQRIFNTRDLTKGVIAGVIEVGGKHLKLNDGDRAIRLPWFDESAALAMDNTYMPAEALGRDSSK